jgi:hypothetical protein
VSDLAEADPSGLAATAIPELGLAACAAGVVAATDRLPGAHPAE